jgi:prophage regulatory protein
MPKIYRLEQVKARTGHRATSTIYALQNNGLFPKAVRIGQRSVGWAAHECDAVIQARIAGCTDAEIKALVLQLHEARKTAMQPLTVAVNTNVTPSTFKPRMVAMEGVAA